MDNNQEEAPKIKRGRGRPRKTPKPEAPPPAPEPEPARASTPMPPPPREYHNEVEELLMPRTTVDTSDIARAMAPPPELPRAAPDEDEVIRLPTMEDEVAAPRGNLPQPPIVLTSPPPPPVDENKRRTVLTRIKRYRESFEAVRAMPFKDDWPLEKLEAHLEEIRIVVGSKTTHVLVKHTYLAAVKGIEVGTCAISMKTYGLTELVAKSAEIDSILKELAAEMGVGAVPPAHRLAIATIGAVLQLDSANKKALVLAGFKKEPVNESINMKYADL